MDDSSDTRRNAVAIFIDGLQSSGRYTFSESEVGEEFRRSDAAIDAALRRLKKARRIAAPRRGFYVIVPPEYRDSGSPPASWFIDDLMRFLRHPYYVGLLSAAAIHGVAPQQPMVFQVVTDAPARDIPIGRIRIDFRMSSTVNSTPVTRVQTETGYMRVSTLEATAFDLVRFARSAGGLGNVATVLRHLAEHLNGDSLATLARDRRAPEVQRLGYLLDLLGESVLADAVAASLAKRRYRPVPLESRSPAGDMPADPRWRVVPNEKVEVEQ